MSTALLRYDAACQALAEAKTVDEVAEWSDKAAAVREYARRINNRSLELDAAEIKERAERRRGELLLELKAAGVLAEGRSTTTVTDQGQLPPRVTLEDLNTSRNESSRAQRIATIPPAQFEQLIVASRQELEEDPRRHAIDVLRERDGPINGARTVMSSRQEPGDSLDYFPTPPWATRALFEHVLPIFGGPVDHVWEPACGEGHITAVLEEYARSTVIATDIFDYTRDGRMPPSWWRTFDFLDLTETTPPVVEWIITNPPFDDKASRFVLRALDLATVGAAMFFRLQWLETIDRYEAIFRDHPPLVVAPFVERVNLCKGRWDPDGSTATAYCWIVWKSRKREQYHDHSARTALFWIPPGCREALTRPTDRERFTAHPVLPITNGEDGSESTPHHGEVLLPGRAQLEPPSPAHSVDSKPDAVEAAPLHPAIPGGAASPHAKDFPDIPPILDRREKPSDGFLTDQERGRLATAFAPKP